MKLYEINNAIAELTDQLDFDPKTGEIGENFDTVMAQIDALNMERQSVLEWIAKVVLNTRAEEAMLKAEEQRLKARRDALSRKEDRLMQILDRECAGQKTPLGIATFSYRKTSHVEVADSEKAVRWLKRHKYLDCFRVPAPEVAKAEVKKLINSGVAVPGCAVVEDYGILKLWQVIRPQINFKFLQHSTSQIDSMTGAKMVIENFQDWVENNGGWRIIQGFDSTKREKSVQSLIHLAAKQFISDNDLDFSCEPDDGHGPVDFKISRGQDKTVIELKLSTNPQYMHGYQEQIRLYAKSENTQNMIYIFVDVGNSGRRKKLEEQVSDDQWSDEIVPEAFIIDATEQLSASIWK